MDRLRKAAMAGIAAFPVHTGKHGQGFYWLAREKPPGVASVQDADARLLKDGRRNRKTPMPTGDVEFRSDGDSSVVRGIGRFGWDAVRLPLLAFLTLVEPVARFALTALALVGILVAVFLEYSDAAPRFPFWLVLGMSLGCGSLVVVLNAVMRRLAR
jgi:hypothetical protein